MTVQELKSHAYDCLAQIEALQRELKATNEAIAQEMQKPVEAVVEAEVVDKPKE
jgi:hypothetical protein